MRDDSFIMRAVHIKNGWRFCHNKSARKHRRAGHHVHYFANGEYRWRRT
jgi:hypothetical protein